MHIPSIPTKRWLTPLLVTSLLGLSLFAARTPVEAEPAGHQPVGDFSIVGGHATDFTRHPSIIQMFRESDPVDDVNGSCGATVIGPRHILTAAHCLEDYFVMQTVKAPNGVEYVTVANLDVAQFSKDHTGTDPIYRMANVYVPPGYLGYGSGNHAYERAYDIAIIQTDRPINQPAMALPAANTPRPTTGLGVVAGWGGQFWDEDGEFYRSDSQGRLFEAAVTINQPAICGSKNVPMICAELPSLAHEPENGASCYGDSGGPLTMEQGGVHVQVGVVSHSGNRPDLPTEHECGHTPTWYTSTSMHRAWIDKVMANPLPPVPPTVQPKAIKPMWQGLDERYVSFMPGKEIADGSTTSVAINQLREHIAGEQAQDWEDLGIAVLASEENFADALASAPLQADTVMYLNARDQLEPEILAELKHHNIREVLILGGHKAISYTVSSQLAANGIFVKRLGGATRVNTAAAVGLLASHAPWNWGAEGTYDYFVARAYGEGSQAYADSISVGPQAINEHRVILLTSTDEPDAVFDSLDFNNADVKLIGGRKAISDTVYEHLKGDGTVGSIDRVSGSNRYATATALANSEQMYNLIVLDAKHPTMWQAGVVSAGLGQTNTASIVLVDETTVPQETVEYLQFVQPDAFNGVVCLARPEACEVIEALIYKNETEGVGR